MMSRLAAVLLTLCLLSASSARAQLTAPQPIEASDTPKAQQAPTSKPSTQAPAPQSEDDFDLLEPVETAAAAQVDPELERRISRRRTMLKLHQGLGLAMAGGLVGTTVLGQIQFNRSFRGGGDDRALLAWHKGFVIGTSALFATVGTLGLLAPEPFEKDTSRWDTIAFHKLFMAIATVGMVTQAILGIAATNNYGNLSEVDLATAHQVVGYATLGAVMAGIVSLTF